MARTLFEVKIHELVPAEYARMLEEKHRLKTLADVDSLTEGGQYMDRLSALHGARAPQTKKIVSAFHETVAALDPKQTERRNFSWLRGKPRDEQHDEGGEG